MSPQDMEASHRDQLTSGSEQLETQRQARLGAVKGWDHELIAYNAPENRPKPNRKVVFQPSIFRGELLVSGRVTAGWPENTTWKEKEKKSTQSTNFGLPAVSFRGV